MRVAPPLNTTPLVATQPGAAILHFMLYVRRDQVTHKVSLDQLKRATVILGNELSRKGIVVDELLNGKLDTVLKTLVDSCVELDLIRRCNNQLDFEYGFCRKAEKAVSEHWDEAQRRMMEKIFPKIFKEVF